jgi:multiubiquitin
MNLRHIVVIVNGREKIVAQRPHSYADIVRVAWELPALDERFVYTVTYKHGPGDREGSMLPGSVMDVVPGMIFNATRTHSA